MITCNRFIQKSVDELEEEIKKNDDFLQEELSKLQKKRVAIQENVEKEESMCLLSSSLMYSCICRKTLTHIRYIHIQITLEAFMKNLNVNVPSKQEVLVVFLILLLFLLFCKHVSRVLYILHGSILFKYLLIPDETCYMLYQGQMTTASFDSHPNHHQPSYYLKYLANLSISSSLDTFYRFL